MMNEDNNKIVKPSQAFYQVTVVVEMEDMETGKIKKTKEIHLVDGASPTDVETKVAKEMEGTMWEWEIVAMTKSRIQIVY